MASSRSSARDGAPPCSGPDRAAMPPVTAAARSAPVEVMTRDVNVEALKPWSMVRIWYCSTARALSGVGALAGEHPQVVLAVAERRDRASTGSRPCASRCSAMISVGTAAHTCRALARSSAASMSSHGPEPLAVADERHGAAQLVHERAARPGDVGQQPLAPPSGTGRSARTSAAKARALARRWAGGPRTAGTRCPRASACRPARPPSTGGSGRSPRGPARHPPRSRPRSRPRARGAPRSGRGGRRAGSGPPASGRAATRCRPGRRPRRRGCAGSRARPARRTPPAPTGRGATQSGSGVISSATLVPADDGPAAARRTMSRSVRMPTGRVPSTTTTEPTVRSSMRVAASATVSSGRAVDHRRAHHSATVRTVGEGVTGAA